MDAAVSERVDFLIIAGDLYDTGLKSFESALFFNKQMARLKDAGIEVYLIHGNHDAASKLIKQLRPPGNVHIFRASEPQTFSTNELRVAIHGQSFATPEITEDLASQLSTRCGPGFFNIGVLHTNLAGNFRTRKLRTMLPRNIEKQRIPILGTWPCAQSARFFAAIRTSFIRETFRGATERSWARRVVNFVTVSDVGHSPLTQSRRPSCHGSRPKLTRLAVRLLTRSTKGPDRPPGNALPK